MLATFATADEAFIYLLKIQPQSFQYAITHGGYRVVQIDEVTA